MKNTADVRLNILRQSIASLIGIGAGTMINIIIPQIKIPPRTVPKTIDMKIFITTSLIRVTSALLTTVSEVLSLMTAVNILSLRMRSRLFKCLICLSLTPRAYRSNQTNWRHLQQIKHQIKKLKEKVPEHDERLREDQRKHKLFQQQFNNYVKQERNWKLQQEADQRRQDQWLSRWEKMVLFLGLKAEMAS